KNHQSLRKSRSWQLKNSGDEKTVNRRYQQRAWCRYIMPKKFCNYCQPVQLLPNGSNFIAYALGPRFTSAITLSPTGTGYIKYNILLCLSLPHAKEKLLGYSSCV